jgi:hypothetical protein
MQQFLKEILEEERNECEIFVWIYRIIRIEKEMIPIALF